MSVQENQRSTLLTEDENQQIFNLIGNRCVTLCTAVVQMYATSGPNHNQWIFREMGVLCFVKDNIQKSYFFRLFCLYKNSLQWEHSLYLNIEYNASTLFFHIFEGENCIIAFNFADLTEAGTFKQIVLTKIVQRNRREERKRARELEATLVQPLQNTTNFSASTLKKTEKKSKKEQKKKNKSKSKVERRVFMKSEIGTPVDFQHISHIGFDAKRGFDLDLKDKNMLELFKNAGVSKSDLSDGRTKSFIANFIEQNGGIKAVRDYNQNVKTTPSTYAGENLPQLPHRPDPSPPPVAKRTDSLGRLQQPREPSPENEYIEIEESSSRQSQITKRKPNRPLPDLPIKQPSQKFTPPPAPPAPSAPPAPPAPPPFSTPEGPVTRNNNALFDSIKQGTALKHVTQAEATHAEPDSRGQLLDAIRQGKTLKAVNMREVNEKAKPIRDNGNDLASALAKALEARSKVFLTNESDESCTSSEDDDDEWDM